MVGSRAGGRVGHASPAAALRYQHASLERDRVIAEKLSRMAPQQPPEHDERDLPARWTRDGTGQGAVNEVQAPPTQGLSPAQTQERAAPTGFEPVSPP